VAVVLPPLAAVFVDADRHPGRGGGAAWTSGESPQKPRAGRRPALRGTVLKEDPCLKEAAKEDVMTAQPGHDTLGSGCGSTMRK
jgi:hypothetical protein